MTPTFHQNDHKVFSNLGTHFVENLSNNHLRVELIVQDASTSDYTIAWKAFGLKSIDGWLYGPLNLKLGDKGFSGSGIAYIYENFDIAILGDFAPGGVLINGTAARIKSYRYTIQLLPI